MTIEELGHNANNWGNTYSFPVLISRNHYHPGLQKFDLLFFDGCP